MPAVSFNFKILSRWLMSLVLIQPLGIFAFAAPTTPAVKPAFSRVSKISASIQKKIVPAYGNLPMSFEKNEGQTDARVKFLARGRGYRLFLTSFKKS